MAPLELHGATLTGDFPTAYALVEELTGTLAPGESRSVAVQFTPVGTGGQTAILSIATNAPNSPHTLALGGAGVLPVVRLSPTSLSFGARPVGTSQGAQAVVVQNTGRAPLSIQSVTIAGANAGDFILAADGCAGTDLQPGDICTLNVGFTPTAPGPRSAVLTIIDNAPGSPHLVPLSGEGTAATVSVSPSSISFGQQLVGTTSDAEQSISLSNTGSAPLTIYSVNLTGAHAGDFALLTDIGGYTLAPGQSGTLTVRFKPTAAGARSATLTISDSAEGSPHLVALSGTGIAPSVTFGISRLGSPNSVAFGNQTVGITSSTQTVTITNSGTAPLTISRIELAGTHAADFAVTGSGGDTLAPNASRTLTLRFTPSATGSRSASLKITDNAPGSPHTIALTGAGIVATGGGGAGGTPCERRLLRRRRGRGADPHEARGDHDGPEHRSETAGQVSERRPRRSDRRPEHADLRQRPAGPVHQQKPLDRETGRSREDTRLLWPLLQPVYPPADHRAGSGECPPGSRAARAAIGGGSGSGCRVQDAEVGNTILPRLAIRPDGSPSTVGLPAGKAA